MYRELLYAVKISLAAGISDLFKVGMVFAVLCFIGTFFLPERGLQGDEYFSDSGEEKPMGGVILERKAEVRREHQALCLL
jgi:hypothetical protein